MQSVVLVGLMGSGKSTVGRALAVRTGVPFLDLDQVIVQRAGLTIPELFAAEGEDGFRVRETAALKDALFQDGPTVVATGGGVVTTESNRDALRRGNATVVYLEASPMELSARLGKDPDRPLLGDDPLGSLTELLEERADLYEAVAHHVLPVTSRPVPGVVDDLAHILGLDPVVTGPVFYEPVRVGGGRDYVVHAGHGVRHHLPEVVPATARRVAVITQEHLPWTVDPGIEHRVLHVPDGETAKDLRVVAEICGQLARWGMTRNDVVVGVGGGVVTDLAGFVASVYHRGVNVIHVPTTLLGQIDAAIGGKCGVNLPEGKNLVGSFWQPSAVLCDTETLTTLPEADYKAGLGELAKYHFLGGGRLDELDMAARVAACVRLKADVVADDEHESGRRAILNYGHTLAHALETVTGYTLRHGSAVAVGLPYAAEVARLLGRIDRDRVEEHFRVLDAYELPATLPDGVNHESLIQLFSRDKKALDGVTFVLDGPDGVESVRVDDHALLREAFKVYDR
ncbi:MAG: bifunctional shikimate kinase/3-dehydroquinate synthase [Acidimicrobiales bacterium]|nr:bifunctional shikimate kinase/3-dehydroquinate synthase [Acidimicrobiales bacterium]